MPLVLIWGLKVFYDKISKLKDEIGWDENLSEFLFQ